MFCRLIVQEKASDDWRSFITYREKGVLYELRGYGSDIISASQDAWNTYTNVMDRDFCSTEVPE